MLKNTKYPSKLLIYKPQAIPYWWARYFIDGKGLRKKTKQQGKREAIEFAKALYDTVTVIHGQGLLFTSAMNFGIAMVTLRKRQVPTTRKNISYARLTKLSCAIIRSLS